MCVCVCVCVCVCGFVSSCSGIPKSYCTFRERRRCGAVCGTGSGKLANDWTSVSSTLVVCCWGNVKLFFGSFGTGSQRVKNASRSKVSQGDRACSEMERGLSISVGFL